MRFIHPIVMAGLVMGLLVLAGTDADKKSQSKQPSKSAAKSAPKPAVFKTSGPTGVSSSNKASKSASAKAPAPKLVAAKKTPSTTPKPAATRYRRSAQLQPTAERYRDIQEALSAKGYFSGPIDGTWGPDSIEALKRFQRDQNLPDDGKIGSLSLIALGLGPKPEGPPVQIGSASALP